MQKERWLEIVSKIKENFKVLEEDKYSEPEQIEVESIEFVNQQGKLRLEYITQPKLVDIKNHYSNRAGASVVSEKIYSDEELTSHLKVFRWSENDQEWIEIKIDNIF